MGIGQEVLYLVSSYVLYIVARTSRNLRLKHPNDLLRLKHLTRGIAPDHGGTYEFQLLFAERADGYLHLPLIIDPFGSKQYFVS